MLDAHADRVAELVGDALQAIKDAFGAEELGQPDHRVRLIAAKRVIEMATAGRTVEASSSESRTITWEQFEALYKGSQAA